MDPFFCRIIVVDPWKVVVSYHIIDTFVYISAE